jgi:hypothetical protein
MNVLTGVVVALSCAVPGDINPAVTQDTIFHTICSSGWTDTVRPPSDETNAIKRKLLRKRYSLAAMAKFELDHCEPLELGGHPRSLKNLWLQRWAGPCGARAKDRAETSLKRLVCSGKVSLSYARRRILHWC